MNNPGLTVSQRRMPKKVNHLLDEGRALFGGV
ncbi:MAG: hypothetical protein ACI9G1_004231, partial [Pirellulaceae bacterium]